MHGGDESIAARGKSFDVAWLDGGVAESLPEFVDGCVQPLLEIDERGARPEVLPQFLAADDLTVAVHEKRQDLEWFALEPDPRTGFIEIAGNGVVLEWAEDQFGRRGRLRSHECWHQKGNLPGMPNSNTHRVIGLGAEVKFHAESMDGRAALRP